MRYSELQCSEAIHKAVERMGFEEMTEIQEKVIPLMMEGPGRDRQGPHRHRQDLRLRHPGGRAHPAGRRGAPGR